MGILATDETINEYTAGQLRSIGSRQEEGSVARGLYKVLREFDHMRVDVIFAESFDEDPLGEAIMNRMKKAAGYSIVNVEG